MPVQILAGTVISHRCPRICMTGRDLNVSETDARVEHGGHERVPEHVRMHPWHANPRRVGQLPEPPGGGVPVHPHAVDIAEDRSGVAAVDGPADRAGYRRR